MKNHKGQSFSSSVQMMVNFVLPMIHDGLKCTIDAMGIFEFDENNKLQCIDVDILEITEVTYQGLPKTLETKGEMDTFFEFMKSVGKDLKEEVSIKAETFIKETDPKILIYDLTKFLYKPKSKK